MPFGNRPLQRRQARPHPFGRARPKAQRHPQFLDRPLSRRRKETCCSPKKIAVQQAILRTGQKPTTGRAVAILGSWRPPQGPLRELGRRQGLRPTLPHKLRPEPRSPRVERPERMDRWQTSNKGPSGPGEIGGTARAGARKCPLMPRPISAPSAGLSGPRLALRPIRSSGHTRRQSGKRGQKQGGRSRQRAPGLSNVDCNLRMYYTRLSL